MCIIFNHKKINPNCTISITEYILMGEKIHILIYIYMYSHPFQFPCLIISHTLFVMERFLDAYRDKYVKKIIVLHNYFVA